MVNVSCPTILLNPGKSGRAVSLFAITAHFDDLMTGVAHGNV